MAGDSLEGETQDPLDVEAERIWFQAVVDAPAAWRARATQAAGLLSAGIAALVGALVLKPPPALAEPSSLHLLAAVALTVGLLSYVCSALCPSPDVKRWEAKVLRKENVQVDDLSYSVRAEKYCNAEAARIRNWAVLGGIASSVAVTSFLFGAMFGEGDGSVRAQVEIIGEEAERVQSRYCLEPGPADVRISRSADSKYVLMEILDPKCNRAFPRLEIAIEAIRIAYR